MVSSLLNKLANYTNLSQGVVEHEEHEDDSKRREVKVRPSPPSSPRPCPPSPPSPPPPSPYRSPPWGIPQVPVKHDPFPLSCTWLS